MNDRVGVMDSYRLGEALKTSARKLGERCGAAAVDMLAHRLAEYIGPAEEDKYSYIWRSAIEDHEQDAHKDGARAVLVDAVRDAALGATSTDSSGALDIARSLLRSPYSTLTRVGIYVCSEHYGTVGTAFWECAKEEWFVEVTYWHELYWFISKNFSRFSVVHRNLYLRFIEQVKAEWPEDSRQEEWNQAHKRDLLHPAFGMGDPEVDERYRDLVQRWGPVRDHPDFLSYSTNGWVVDRSPVTSDLLVRMSDEDLVTFLKSFVPDGRGEDGSTYRGLASSLSAAVRASEDGFEGKMGLFETLARPYQHGLLRGLKERWSDDKRSINWSATLSLLQKIVSSPTFEADLKSDQRGGWEPSVHWVVSDIADLLKGAAGTERPLPLELYDECLTVLRLALSTIPVETGQADDAVSHAINSPRGRTLESFIYLSLAMRREELASSRNVGATWLAIGPIFDAELKTSESGLNPDFAALAGMYCTNFHYLNAEWTETNFDRLFSSTNEAAWRCAAQGFSYQRYMYDWLFKHLVIGGHLRKMLYSEGLPGQVAEKALQFLGLAYLEGTEALDGDGLLSELITELRIEELSRLCWFFWTLRTKVEPSERTSKILAFWIRVAEQVRVRRVEAPKLQSALSQLAIFISDLSPALVEAMVDAAPHAQVGHHGYLLIQNLARLAGQFPRDVATIFRAAMSGFLPDYREEDVVGCVVRLADSGEIEAAEWICNAYAERGSNLLKATYAEIRARQRAPLDGGRSSSGPS